MKILHATFPLELPSLANVRMHHMRKHSLMKRQRTQAWAELRAVSPHIQVVKAPIRITLTRVSPRRLDGHDNLRSAFKAVADGVADWLGIDDGDPMLQWTYAQRAGLPKQRAVEILIEDAR